jgi:hypothetical protein
MKFNSSRLKDKNYKINIELREARANDEIVALGESEIIRAILRLKGLDNSRGTISQLTANKKLLQKQSDTKDNRKKIKEINRQLDNILFVPEIVNVQFDDARHYKNIIDDGLFINDIKYNRLLTGSGMARASTVQFVQEGFYEIELKAVLDNYRDKTKAIVPAKYAAYSALLSSATYPITQPKFCVVKDYKYSKKRLVDYVVEIADADDYVEERFIDIETNAFDGQGIVSPKMAKIWSMDLGIMDYTPNSFCIRGAFLKGQCVVFDFHKFAEEISHNYIIQDIWGNNVDIYDVDVIITESQLKLWFAYNSCAHYVECSNKSHIGWGVSRTTPKIEKDMFLSSYQLLQVLDLSESQIRDMCFPTIDWITHISYSDANHALLYLLGSMCDNEILQDNWFSNIKNPNIKALLLNHKLYGDAYIKKIVAQSLNKKIKESKMGKLLFPGNWQVNISDPYAFCEYVFGMEVKGLLEEEEHFSQYWIRKGVSRVASGRSPLTWKSEMNILNFKNNPEIQKWYGHLNSGIVFNIHGVDCMLMADSDFDFDLSFSTSQKEFIDGASRGKPVTYEKKVAQKEIITDENLYKSDINSMGSKIGLITNIGTTTYCLLPLYKPDSIEYKILIERLIILRKLQGAEIDKTKFGSTKALPKWDKWINITDNMDANQKAEAELKNKLIVNRRPRFMIYLYPEFLAKYRNHRSIYENYCESVYNCSLDDLLNNSNRNVFQEDIYKKYQEFNPYIETNSIMGSICSIMEKNMEDVKSGIKDNKDFNYNDMINCDIKIDSKKLSMMDNLYKQYKKIKIIRDKTGSVEHLLDSKYAELISFAYENISNNSSELANLSVYLCYKNRGASSRDFCWRLFGNEMVNNLINNGYDRAYIPLLDQSGDIHYLGKRYSVLGHIVKGG